MDEIKKEIQKLSTILFELYITDKLSEEDFNKLFEVRCEVLILLNSSKAVVEGFETTKQIKEEIIRLTQLL